MARKAKVFAALSAALIGFLVIFIDRTLKDIALSLAGEGFFGAWQLAGFVPSRNPGIAFGISWFPNAAVIAITLALLAAVSFFLAKNIHRARVALALSQAFIIGGGISNLVDRIVLGEVIDYIYIRWYSNFNIADAAIVLGSIGWLLLSARKNAKVRA